MPPRGSSFNSKMGGKRAEKPLKTLVRLFRYFKNCTGILIVSIISILAYSAAPNSATSAVAAIAARSFGGLRPITDAQVEDLVTAFDLPRE